MKALAPIVICLLLAGCADKVAPEIQTREVMVAVPTPCVVKVDGRPALKNKAEVRVALAAAPNLDERLKIVTEQLLLYMGWTPKVEAGLRGCQGEGTPK